MRTRSVCASSLGCEPHSYPIQSDRLCSGFEEKQSVELQSCLRIQSPSQAKILLKASFIILPDSFTVIHNSLYSAVEAENVSIV